MPRHLYIALGVLLIWFPALINAQDDDVSLGDLARAARSSKPDDDAVIDNDNLKIVMDKAESERLNGKPVFSIDPSGKSFRMTSPDGTCSLSFDAKATALISTPYVASELPQDELLKLEGPANIHGGILEVSLHNGTAWELKEIVVGITVLEQPLSSGSSSTGLKAAKLSSVADTTAPTTPAAKSPDVTTLYHLKASAFPDSITVFRGSLGNDFDSSKDWHWALVSARGIPPAASSSVVQSGVNGFPASPVDGPAPANTSAGELSSAPTEAIPAAAPTNAPPGFSSDPRR